MATKIVIPGENSQRGEGSKTNIKLYHQTFGTNLQSTKKQLCCDKRKLPWSSNAPSFLQVSANLKAIS